jgi:hypothetical protein
MPPPYNKENARRNATPQRADANPNDGEQYQFARLTAMFAAAISNLSNRLDGDGFLQQHSRRSCLLSVVE